MSFGNRAPAWLIVSSFILIATRNGFTVRANDDEDHDDASTSADVMTEEFGDDNASTIPSYVDYAEMKLIVESINNMTAMAVLRRAADTEDKNAIVERIAELIALGGPSDLVNYARWDAEYRNVLHWAVRCRQESVVRLLVRVLHGINANVQDSGGKTPLHWAAEQGYSQIARHLLGSTGIIVNARDSSGRSPLHLAAENGHNDLVTLLVKDSDIDVNAQDDEDVTPLHKAAIEGRGNVILSLLRAEGKINAYVRDGQGRTALDWARLYLFDRIAAQIEAHMKEHPEPELARRIAGVARRFSGSLRNLLRTTSS
ncbi:Ankyrin repeat domain-containing protein [Plasmodiophora brassicae]|uniref:Uncharacterized protein n=1 Tax=Plasmodiophora brassicae TaxID=37360 RepID=A0A0G4J2L2_PLABS|nr:hypothetical protein PBRA_002137 [Plasmodiophora brassicae]SPQ93191.1 unnamed protein product [Plasmodiophora brassicae]